MGVLLTIIVIVLWLCVPPGKGNILTFIQISIEGLLGAIIALLTGLLGYGIGTLITWLLWSKP